MGKTENNQCFVFGVSVSDYNFIGREDEIRQLRMNFEEGINTILISPRRWGKTSLVKRVCREVDKEKVITVGIGIVRLLPTQIINPSSALLQNHWNTRCILCRKLK